VTVSVVCLIAVGKPKQDPIVDKRQSSKAKYRPRRALRNKEKRSSSMLLQFSSKLNGLACSA